MQRLSVKLQLTCGERIFDELHLQHWMDRARWRLVHSMCCRKVQGIDRTSRVQRLCSKDVFGRSKSRYMQRLSVSLQLACGERSFDELHLQRRLVGAGWRHVHSVRSRQI